MLYNGPLYGWQMITSHTDFPVLIRPSSWNAVSGPLVRDADLSGGILPPALCQGPGGLQERERDGRSQREARSTGENHPWMC